MGLSLYEIDDKFKSVLAELEAMDDIDQDCIDDTMSVFKDDLDKKCLSVAAFIKNLTAEAEAVKGAKDTLASRQKALESKAKRMREYLAAHLPGKLSDSQTTISPIKGRESVRVLNDALLPDSCFKTTRSVVASEVKNMYDELPTGAAEKVISAPSVMIK